MGDNNIFQNLFQHVGKINTSNSYETNVFSVVFLNKLNKMVNCGYMSVSDIDVLTSQTQMLLKTLIKKKGGNIWR